MSQVGVACCQEVKASYYLPLTDRGMRNNDGEGEQLKKRLRSGRRRRV